MAELVKVRERGSAIVVSKRLAVRLSEIGSVIGTSFGEVYDYLAGHGVPTSEPPFIVYHEAPGPDGGPFEIEICAPVGRAVDPPGGWTLVELPGGTFASVVHVGPYDGLGTTYERLHAWIRGNGLVESGAPREVYLSEPSTPPDQIRTVVEFPVAQARSEASIR